MTPPAQLSRFLAAAYRTILIAMIVLLVSAAVAAFLNRSGESRLPTIIIELVFLLIPVTLLAFGIYALSKRQMLLGNVSLLLFAIWGVFKLIG